MAARTLANELDDLDTPIVLVLDDYHRISGESEVHELLSRPLEHPPPTLRLVITTRRDPPLSLGALRAAGRLTEVRLQDLRFTDWRSMPVARVTRRVWPWPGPARLVFRCSRATPGRRSRGRGRPATLTRQASSSSGSRSPR